MSNITLYSRDPPKDKRLTYEKNAVHKSYTPCTHYDVYIALTKLIWKPFFRRRVDTFLCMQSITLGMLNMTRNAAYYGRPNWKRGVNVCSYWDGKPCFLGKTPSPLGIIWKYKWKTSKDGKLNCHGKTTEPTTKSSGITFCLT